MLNVQNKNAVQYLLNINKPRELNSVLQVNSGSQSHILLFSYQYGQNEVLDIS